MSYQARNFRVKTAIAAVAAVVSCSAAGVTAQEQFLEEVLVTATKRTESLQDVAVAVTAFSEFEIQEAGIVNAKDLAELTPSLTISTNLEPFNAAVRIRGIGTSQYDPALEPSVGNFIDGVYMSRSGLGMSDLTDVQRIEVLQGPQGTLYGKNTNAGAVSVFTKSPNIEQTEGYVEATAGDYDLQRYTFSVSGPISEQFAYRLAGNLHKMDGYIENVIGPDFNDKDEWNLQGKLLFQPTDELSVLLNAAHVERDINCCAPDALQNGTTDQLLLDRGLPLIENDWKDYKTAADQLSEFEMYADMASLTIDYDLGWANLVSLTAWQKHDYVTSTDTDRSPLDVLILVDDNRYGESFSQEFRLTGYTANGWEYQLGLYYMEDEVSRGNGDDTGIVRAGEDIIAVANLQPNLPLPVSAAFLVQPGDELFMHNVWNSETLAIFGQLTVPLGDNWDITGGLRFSDEKKEADLYAAVNSTSVFGLMGVGSLLEILSTPIDASLDRETDNTDWLINLRYRPTDGTMIYASASTGTKSGGFNGVSGNAENREFEDESAISYELGLKAQFWDNKLRLNAALLNSQYDEFQSIEEVPGIGTVVSNESQVDLQGIDIQLDAVPLPYLTLAASVQYLDKAEFSEGARAGQTLPFAPEISAVLGATVQFPLADGTIFARADYSYMSDHETIASQTGEQERELVNLRLGWRNEAWNAALWVKNATDDVYASVIAGENSIAGVSPYFLETPRTSGLTVRYSFGAAR